MSAPSRVYKPAVGPRLRRVLGVVFLLFAVLSVNSVYLASVTFAQWRSGTQLQGSFYLWMFLAHLVLGLGIILPVVVFGVLHLRTAWGRPNKRAVRAGLALFTVALILLASGIALTRVEISGIEVGFRTPVAREVVYWIHALLPLVAVWLFILHRLAGRRIRWSTGAWWSGAALALTGLALALHARDAAADRPTPKAGDEYFEPSLARTRTGAFVPASSLMMNDYCLECHKDAYQSWSHSMHALSSFNNPLYAFSVRETRRKAFEREGDVHDARFCAGCHDPVPFFSGAFEDKRFDDPAYDLAGDPLASAGLTCNSCHSIIAAEGVRGNAAYTIEESPQYPFTFSTSPLLAWANRQLVKAKPQFHKNTYLKPEVHKGSEFCSACHKVFLPTDLNDYKWLRGQDHYDSFRLSGVSGHGIQAWYWPEKAKPDCNSCHMEALPSTDFGSKERGGIMTMLNHQFPSANTAIPLLADVADPDTAIDACVAFNEGVVRVDIVALREGAQIDGKMSAPLRPSVPVLQPGGTYLLDVVTRNVKVGHALTQGTADSNELWLDVTFESLSVEDAEVIGRSGAFGPDNEVDPWAKFLNIFMLDRNGNRLDRRNPEDIFVPLYDYQVPPGAADVTRYRLTVPSEGASQVRVSVALRYRKFDTTFLKHALGAETVNNLPVMTLARDEVSFWVGAEGLSAASADFANTTPKTPTWERLSDYGIGLFRLGDSGSRKGDLRGAEEVFRQVEKLGQGAGSLGLARVYLKEGRVDDAARALNSAMSLQATPWSATYFIAKVDWLNGRLEEALVGLERVRSTDFAEGRARGFDFSMDDRLLLEIAQLRFDIARKVRSEAPAAATDHLARAQRECEAALALDPESVGAWHTLALVADDLGNKELAERARSQHARYKPDENARDRAVNMARMKYPAADHAAEPMAVFDLQRPGAPRGDVEPFAIGPAESRKVGQ